jgi:transglutaminase-like putative cysteine protease
MSGAPIVYQVTHRTEYRYAAPVSLSQQLLHLQPRSAPRQACLEHALQIVPTPTRRHDSTDAFGNPVTRLEFDRPHESLSITAVSRLQLVPRAAPAATTGSPPWESVAAELSYRGARAVPDVALDAMRFRSQSPFVLVKRTLADYARRDFTPQRPLLEASIALMQRIHAEFAYDQKATQIATPLLQVFEQRRGVCQDFAHVMLACLRSLGLSARYVSGYLRSTRDPAREALVGADASHAWLAVYCPRNGWVDLDPTNRVLPDLSHLTLAWGRDFGDISPLRGVILGGGSHKLEVAVSMRAAQPPGIGDSGLEIG